jgi:hypothetical protein
MMLSTSLKSSENTLIDFNIITIFIKKNCMIYIILTTIILIFLFILMLVYKLSDVNWFHQFITQDFKDKDCFTRLVKWLMKK